MSIVLRYLERKGGNAMPCLTIAIANQKGGVAKTTTVSELGELLSQQYHKKVLMIDIDPQASLTSIKGDMNDIIINNRKTMSNVMLRQSSIDEIVIPIKTNLYLAPATLVLSDVELNIINATLRELILKAALNSMLGSYDFVLIDCPPSRGLLTVNALSASDYVLIPIQAEYQALLGLQLLKNTVANVQSQINKELKVWGYVVTMTTRTNQSSDTLNEIKKDHYPILSTIPRSTKVSDAGVANMSTHEFDTNNPAGLAYLKLSEKLIGLEM